MCDICSMHHYSALSHGLHRRCFTRIEVGYPLDLLRDVAVVDTPGTNAILREHEEITSHFVPRADLVLFVTSADRPFTETERAFMERIRAWGKKSSWCSTRSICSARTRWPNRWSSSASGVERLLGFRPEVFPVSARLALAAKDEADPARAAAWAREPLPGAGGLRQRHARRARSAAAEAVDAARHRRAHRANV